MGAILSVRFGLTILIMDTLGSYDGAVIVDRSIEMREPVIFVSMNYR